MRFHEAKNVSVIKATGVSRVDLETRPVNRQRSVPFVLKCPDKVLPSQRVHVTRMPDARPISRKVSLCENASLGHTPNLNGRKSIALV
jgi:hypothetical protein